MRFLTVKGGNKMSELKYKHKTFRVGDTVYKKGWAVTCKGRITEIIISKINNCWDNVKVLFDNGEHTIEGVYELKDGDGIRLKHYDKGKNEREWYKKYGDILTNTPEYEAIKNNPVSHAIALDEKEVTK